MHTVPAGHDLQDSCGTLDGNFDLNWEAEKELEAVACDGEDFIPPKIMVRISALLLVSTQAVSVLSELLSLGSS